MPHPLTMQTEFIDVDLKDVPPTGLFMACGVYRTANWNTRHYEHKPGPTRYWIDGREVGQAEYAVEERKRATDA